MNRQTFLISTGAAGSSALLSSSASITAAEPGAEERFSWNAGQLQFEFSVVEGRLRKHLLLPVGFEPPHESLQWSAVEAALFCSDEDSPDPGMKQSGGSPSSSQKTNGQVIEESGR